MGNALINCWQLSFFLLLTVVALDTGCEHTPGNFYPLGIYGVPDAQALAAIRQAGFNVAVGTASQPYLDAADRLGLKVMAAPGTTAGKDFSSNRARRLIAAFDRHPALWAWSIADEPDLNQVAPAEVRAAAQFMKRAGAHKPTALALYQGTEALHYGNIADITMIDRYPIPWLPLANFPQHVRLARLALGRNKPLIAVVQAFDWTYYPSLAPGTNMRAPTHPELRCMTYSALARRASGLFYYAYEDGAWQLPDHPETWSALRDTIAEVKERLPLFRAEHRWWTFRHEYPDGSGFNEALESSISPALLRVHTGNATVPSGDYLLAVNTTGRTVTYRIGSSTLLGNEVPVLGENRRAALSDGWLQDSFGPFDVHIYGPIPRAEAPRPDRAARQSSAAKDKIR